LRTDRSDLRTDHTDLRTARADLRGETQKMQNPHSGNNNWSKSSAAAGRTGAEQLHKPGLTSATMANNVAAQNRQRKATTTEPAHQPWYHWMIP
jgi:hypothetical protein